MPLKITERLALQLAVVQNAWVNKRAVGGQRVELGRLGDAVAIAAQLQPQIVGHDQHDVFLSGGRRC